MSKVMGFFSIFGSFYHAHSPDMVMSCHSSFKFQKNLFCFNSTFNIRKSDKISSGNLSASEVISLKPHGGGEHPLHCL